MILVLQCYLAILLHVTDPALVDALAVGAGELSRGVALHVGALRPVTPVATVVLVVTPPVLGHTLPRLAPECLTLTIENLHCFPN